MEEVSPCKLIFLYISKVILKRNCVCTMNWGKALPPKTPVSVHQHTQMGDKVSMCKKYGKGLVGKNMLIAHLN